jgi:hypothetical protein
MPLTKITTHATDAIARLIEQYRDKAGMRALVNAFASRAQALENSVWDLFTLRDIDSATLDALDQLGAIVGQARQSAVDADYRPYVRTRIRINRSSGGAEDLIEVLRLVVPVGTTVHLTDLYPASFRIDLGGDVITPAQAVAFAKFIREARAAGVGGVLIWNETDGREFQFDVGTDYEHWFENAGSHNTNDIVIGNGCVFRLQAGPTGPGPDEPVWSSAPNVGDEVEEDGAALFGGPWVWENIKPAASGDGYNHGLGFVDPATQTVDTAYGGRLQGVVNTF